MTDPLGSHEPADNASDIITDSEANAMEAAMPPVGNAFAEVTRYLCGCSKKTAVSIAFVVCAVVSGASLAGYIILALYKK